MSSTMLDSTASRRQGWGSKGTLETVELGTLFKQDYIILFKLTNYSFQNFTVRMQQNIIKYFKIHLNSDLSILLHSHFQVYSCSNTTPDNTLKELLGGSKSETVLEWLQGNNDYTPSTLPFLFQRIFLQWLLPCAETLIDVKFLEQVHLLTSSFQNSHTY